MELCRLKIRVYVVPPLGTIACSDRPALNHMATLRPVEGLDGEDWNEPGRTELPAQRVSPDLPVHSHSIE